MNIIDLPNEVFYRILFFLDIRNIKKLFSISSKLFEKILGYNFQIIFVNNKEKINYYFIFNFDYFLRHMYKIVDNLESICNNDFIIKEDYENVCFNVVNYIDIRGLLVFRYYISYLQGHNFYLLPKFKNFNNLILEDFDYYPITETYFDYEINIKSKIEKYIIPNKNYKNIIYRNYNKKYFNSNLIS